MLGRPLQQIEQSGHKSVDPASQILEVEDKDIRARHHGIGRAAHFAIKREHRNAVLRVNLVGGFHHIVLLIAFQPVLRAKGAGHIKPGCNQGVKAMR